MKHDMQSELVRVVLKNHPGTQAVYLFGSYGTADEWPDSDVDIAVLLPPMGAKQAGHLALSETQFELERLLGRTVDLINIRLVSTVMQMEICGTGRRIYTGDEYSAEEFEMHTLSFYQKLNEERAETLAEGLRSGGFYSHERSNT